MSSMHGPVRPKVRSRLAWLTAPDASLIEFGAGGARRISQVRAAIFACLLATGIASNVLTDEPLAPIATSVAALGLVCALLVAWRVRAGEIAPKLSFVNVTIDVTLISSILVSFALDGQPEVAANSMFVWELYLFAIVASALYFDLRVVLFTGIVAVAQWSAVLAWVANTYGLPAVVKVDADHIELMQALRMALIGGFTAAAALMVLRTARLVQLSGTDPLTGLANRALLDQRLVEAVASARRWGRPLSVAFLDIDHFKKFNDRYGHRAGDEALRSTARALIEESRESDVIARWGGEEFVLVLPDAVAKDAAMAVERLRARLAVTPISGLRPDVRVTLSAGVAEFPTDADEAGALEQVADRRLLVAKRSGRDRVVSHG